MRIQNKLFLTMLIAISLLVAAMFMLMQWSIDRGMVDYVNSRDAQQWQTLAEELETRFALSDSWSQFRQNPALLHELARSENRFTGNRLQYRRPPPPRNRRDNRSVDRASHPSGSRPEEPNSRPPPRRGNPRPNEMPPVMLSDALQNLVVGHDSKKADYQSIPLENNGEIIGYLLVPKQHRITDGYELRFLEQQREGFAFISLLILVLAAITSFPIARHVVAPIKKLAIAAQRLTQGDYSQPTESTRRDELGELARDFAHLNKTLKNNDTARKRWLADTSHELRTPLAILQSELEALQDGIRPVTDKALKSIHQEILHLGKLVEDLYELSNADIGAMRYRMQIVAFDELLEEVCELHRSQCADKGLQLQLQNSGSNSSVWGDETRLTQLLNNLMNNAVKYTDSGGTVQVSLTNSDANITLSIEDSAPGVSDLSLTQLFDHLYRVEDSRNRKLGGSGLGLAICKRIVEAHSGTIVSSHSELGGVMIRIELPLGTV